MKSILIFALLLITAATTPWEPNFEQAKKKAKENNQLILLNFSGSDWCGPCIRMHKEIFEDTSFLKMANDNLVMVNADFPRNKKNQLALAVKKQNESLADQYNSEGKFPFTVLLDANGKIIKFWEGLPDETATQFTAEIKKLCDANK